VSALYNAILTAIRSGQPASASDAVKSALSQKMTMAVTAERRSLSEGLLKESKGIITKAKDGGVNLTVMGSDGKKATFWYKTRESAVEYAKSDNITLAESTTRVWELQFKGRPAEVDALRKKGYNAIMLAGGTIRVEAPDQNDGWGAIGAESAMWDALGLGGDKELGKRKVDYKILREGFGDWGGGSESKSGKMVKVTCGCGNDYHITAIGLPNAKCPKCKKHDVKKREFVTEAAETFKCYECGAKFSKAKDQCSECGGGDVDVYVPVINTYGIDKKRPKNITEASRQYCIAGKTKDGDVEIFLGNSEMQLSGIYNGWKNSGDKYPRVGRGKIPKNITDDELKKRTAAQFGVDISKVKLTLKEGFSAADFKKKNPDYKPSAKDAAEKAAADADKRSPAEKKAAYDADVKARLKKGRLQEASGFEAMAQRLTNAEERFIEYAMKRAKLSRTEAEHALSVMRKGGKKAPVKLDIVSGQFSFSHGAFGEPDVLRRAAHLKESLDMPVKTVQRVFDENGDVGETEILCGIRGLKVKDGNVLAYINEATNDDGYDMDDPDDVKRSKIADLRIKWRTAGRSQRDAIEKAIAKLRRELNEGTKYVMCPECEACFPDTQLVNGKLPPHKGFRGEPTCPGAGLLGEGIERTLVATDDNVVKVGGKSISEAIAYLPGTQDRVSVAKAIDAVRKTYKGSIEFKSSADGRIGYEIDGVWKTPGEAMKALGIEFVKEDTFKKIAVPLAPLNTRVRRVNAYLADTVGKKYYPQIPINDMFAKLRENGLEPIQEDGESWSGLLTGRDGRAIIDLRDEETGKTSPRALTVSWHKMDQSGRYEVTAYVS